MSIHVNDSGTIKTLGIELSEGFTINGIDKIYESTQQSKATITLPRNASDYKYFLLFGCRSSTTNNCQGLAWIDVAFVLSGSTKAAGYTWLADTANAYNYSVYFKGSNYRIDSSTELADNQIGFTAPQVRVDIKNMILGIY